MHHRFKVLAYFARERQPLDGCHRTQQRQHTNVIGRERTAYCARALDQLIQLFEVGEKIAEMRAAARERHGWIMDIYLLRTAD